MKKLLLLLIFPVFMACSGDDEYYNPVEGIWTDTPQGEDGWQYTSDFKCNRWYLKFPESFYCTYTIDENTITETADNSLGPQKYDYRIWEENGHTYLGFTYSPGGKEYVRIKRK
ncbi:MAG: hypothetical protein LBR26_15940 [Prevotella sp.]|jgi:hypothetical protein|nr:hypothetical protein [Prevotella sp.]